MRIPKDERPSHTDDCNAANDRSAVEICICPRVRRLKTIEQIQEEIAQGKVRVEVVREPLDFRIEDGPISPRGEF